MFHPENVAERALVECLLESFAALAGQDLSDPDRDALLGEIVLNVHARQAHVLLTASFRDYVRDSLWVAPVTIDEDDDAFLKLGLGWRLRKHAQGGNIVGKEECLSYLNPLVKLLEDEICQELRQLGARFLQSGCQVRFLLPSGTRLLPLLLQAKIPTIPAEHLCEFSGQFSPSF